MNFFELEPEAQKAHLTKLHHEQLMSAYDIAKQLGTYPNRIYRLIPKIGFEFMSQKEFLNKKMAARLIYACGHRNYQNRRTEGQPI